MCHFVALPRGNGCEAKATKVAPRWVCLVHWVDVPFVRSPGYAAGGHSVALCVSVAHCESISWQRLRGPLVAWALYSTWWCAVRERARAPLGSAAGRARCALLGRTAVPATRWLSLVLLVA